MKQAQKESVLIAWTITAYILEVMVTRRDNVLYTRSISEDRSVSDDSVTIAERVDKGLRVRLNYVTNCTD